MDNQTIDTVTQWVVKAWIDGKHRHKMTAISGDRRQTVFYIDITNVVFDQDAKRVTIINMGDCAVSGPLESDSVEDIKQLISVYGGGRNLATHFDTPIPEGKQNIIVIYMIQASAGEQAIDSRGVVCISLA